MKRGLAMAVVTLTLAAGASRGEAVRNGNELALTYTRADAPGKAAIRKESEGKLHTFRFLKVFRIDPDPAGGFSVYFTREPSSDLVVEIHPQGPVSRQVVAAVATNDCLAVNGRLAKIGESPESFVVQPAVIRSKDRPAPKGEKELLHEIDPNAVK